MIDYLKLLNVFANIIKIQKQSYLTILISADIVIIIFIAILLALIKSVDSYLISESSALIGTLMSVIILVLITPAIVSIVKPYFENNQNISTKLAKYNINENITIDTIVNSNNVYLHNNPNITYQAGNFYEFPINTVFNGLNIKSVNNFCLNIIYLNDYYNNHYTTENRYDWINQQLNNFYQPNSNTDISTDEVLQNLKN